MKKRIRRTWYVIAPLAAGWLALSVLFGFVYGFWMPLISFCITLAPGIVIAFVGRHDFGNWDWLLYRETSGGRKS
jgi:fatty acid desaturase